MTIWTFQGPSHTPKLSCLRALTHAILSLKSPHFTHLLILTMHGPSSSSSNAELCASASLKMSTTINSRVLVPAGLLILPRILLSLSTQSLSFCKKVSLSHFPYSQQSTSSIVLLHEKIKMLRQELFQVYL